MLKALLCWLVVLECVLMPAPSWGEEIYPGRWWHIPQVAEKLALSEAQKQQLDALFLDNRGKLVEFKSALERERAELDAQLEKEPVDEAAVMAQLKRLEGARTNLASERLRFGLEVRKILGYEKFQELRALFKDYREKRIAPLPPPKKHSGIRHLGPFHSYFRGALG